MKWYVLYVLYQSLRSLTSGWFISKYSQVAALDRDHIVAFKSFSQDGGIFFERDLICNPVHIPNPSPPASVATATPPNRVEPDTPLIQLPVHLPSRKRSASNSVHDNTGQIAGKKQKTLDTWFQPGMRDSLLAYHQRTDDEWASKREQIERIEKEVSEAAKKLKTSLAMDRKQKQRARQVVEDIKSGKQDQDGNIIKLKVAKLPLLKYHDHTVPLESRNGRIVETLAGLEQFSTKQQF
ncbi:hypothetical protein HYPSUDRAFT_56927 [Hypholoma sublateritium FD-334 SS-4]|uniref:Uncharacterized protein n=1 Tax=Hypholoma sublateritium (strain FD-334 SS-4) TaxID=945553 RepID=A0A0D2NJ09_HYPSF|nr:hypothetical protein HYPSUDRAFT_56927 [Hypholoma sublateritium FD-334 SS-4]